MQPDGRQRRGNARTGRHHVTATPEVKTSNPVVTEPPAVALTEEPSNNNEPLDYFVEEFDNGVDNYSYFVKHGDEDKADVYAEDGELKFTLNDYDIYYYVLYDPYTYGDVRLDVGSGKPGSEYKLCFIGLQV